MNDFSTALTRLWPRGDEKIPGLRAGMIASAPAVFSKYGITSPLLISHVMAQISHECGAGHEVIENLSYSALRMTQVWPSRFPTVAGAHPYDPGTLPPVYFATELFWAHATTPTWYILFGSPHRSLAFIGDENAGCAPAFL